MRAKVKRPYRSTRRREQAGETRRRIIRAAHDLFVSQGYGRTTIAEVASAAGVAVETVYAAFRNKHTLLRQVWYATFRGDEQDIRLLDRPEIRAVLAEPDLATRLRAHAVALTPVFRRITPLLRALQGATTSEPAAAAMLAEFDQRRLDAAGHYARAAAATGQLDVGEQECSDLLAATMEGALWYRLVEERGWSEERFAHLLGTMWVAALVRSASVNDGSRRAGA
jgi:AcrR family transcriptional regulator